jgi:hypothetical protein
MAMAVRAMPGETSRSPPLPASVSLRSPIYSPASPLRSPSPAVSIPVKVKVADPAAVAAMEVFNPGRVRRSCCSPEIRRQDASHGGENRLADASSTAARFPASSSSRTQQHMASDVLAGKKVR